MPVKELMVFQALRHFALQGCFSFVVFGIIQGNPIAANAQLLNQTVIRTTGNAEVHVVGSVSNEGLIINNGNLFVSENWKNSKVYQGSGTISFNGKEAQTIDNNNQAVSQLVVKGGGTKIIKGNLAIEKSLTLEQGIVKSSDVDTLTISQTAIVNGGSTQSFIDGPLISIGTGYKFFPVGHSGQFAPIELIDVKGITPVLCVQSFSDFPPAEVQEASLHHDLYWKCSVIKGSFGGSATALSIYNQIQDRDNLIVVSADEDKNFNLHKLVDVQGDKVTTSDEIQATYLLLAQFIPTPLQPLYLSRALSPRALNEENRSIRVFGEVLVQENFSFQVFSRAGAVVFETLSLEEMTTTGWLGTKNGSSETLPSGAYPFILKAKTVAGKSVVEKGVVSIIN